MWINIIILYLKNIIYLQQIGLNTLYIIESNKEGAIRNFFHVKRKSGNNLETSFG